MKKILSIAFLVIVAASQQNCRLHGTASGPKVNGIPARAEFKNISVILQDKQGSIFCSGGVVQAKPLIIATAAHCVFDFKVTEYFEKKDDKSNILTKVQYTSEFRPLLSSELKVQLPGGETHSPIKIVSSQGAVTDNQSEHEKAAPQRLKTVAEGLAHHDLAFLIMAAEVEIPLEAPVKVAARAPASGDSIWFVGARGDTGLSFNDFKEGKTQLISVRNGEMESIEIVKNVATENINKWLKQAPEGENVIFDGDSGGLVFNMDGEIVGVNSARKTYYKRNDNNETMMHYQSLFVNLNSSDNAALFAEAKTNGKIR